ncbi:uncharacterized protein LOC105664530 isoform X2 [Ceratitis capitata]|uniref:uncharacterized protein LOC105664530 isoform X2 n=1 Tax=Ceratitis capitata TaxID=7213 RepID=UPI0006188CD1|nr:uncharacterized protein LOC105664530 isoform X2 [Ceratitis capitata]
MLMPKPQNFDKCRLCCRTHSLPRCHAFLAMTPDERYVSAKVHKYCIKCLANSYATGSSKRAPKQTRDKYIASGQSKKHQKEQVTVTLTLTKFRSRISGLVSEAKKALQQSEELVHVTTLQAPQHVEDMEDNPD